MSQGANRTVSKAMVSNLRFSTKAVKEDSDCRGLRLQLTGVPDAWSHRRSWLETAEHLGWRGIASWLKLQETMTVLIIASLEQLQVTV